MGPSQPQKIGQSRQKATDYRPREYLRPDEVEKLIEAAKKNRYGNRDAAIIFFIYRHALRVQEAADLEWSSIDWPNSEMHIRRVKCGKSAVHPIRGDELRMLRKLEREAASSRYLFVNERGRPFTAPGIAKMVKRLGDGSHLLGFPVHVHQLRHAAGYKLANDGHPLLAIRDYMGHRSVVSTQIYSELCPTKYRDFWR